MSDKSSRKLTNTKLIIVEGRSDEALFKNLLLTRGLTGFDVWCPENGGGEDNIIHVLNGVIADPNFPRLEKILIVVDSDENGIDKLSKFQQIIRNCNTIDGDNRYPVPTALCEFASNPNVPSIAIKVLPTQDNGAMESLCWEAGLEGKVDLVNCIDAFVECCNFQDWTPQKIAKLKLRLLISAQFSQNPDLPTTRLWDVAPEIVPLQASVFDDIVQYLVRL